EHGAKREAKDFGFFIIACCRVPNACFHLITLCARVLLDLRLCGHRITLSALANTFGGIVNPICLAPFRLMMNSNFVGCSIGRSAGFLPFKILSMKIVARRQLSGMSGP